MYGRAFGFSLKYFFKSPLWLVTFLLCAALTVIPLVFVSTPAIPVAVYDYDNTPQSTHVLETIQKNGLLDVREMDYADAVSSLSTGGLEAVFEIKQGFGDRITQGEYADTVTLRLSNYSTGARTLSDAMAAAVIQEYTVYEAGNTVFDVTGSEQLSQRARDAASAETVQIISVETSGLTQAESGNGVASSLSILGVAIGFAALCFMQPFDAGFSEKAVSFGASAPLLSLVSQLGKLFPLLCLAAIPLTVQGGVAYCLPTAALFIVYAVCLCVLSALIARARLALRLNIAVFFSILNAIFGLSSVFSGAAPVVAGIFPAYWLSSGIAQTDWLPAVALLAIGGICFLLLQIKTDRK